MKTTKIFMEMLNFYHNDAVLSVEGQEANKNKIN